MAALVCQSQRCVRLNTGRVVLLLALTLAFGPWTCSAQFGPWTSSAQLSPFYYDKSCPKLQSTVQSAFNSALSSDGRIGASLIRMHFHDCMVNGCDGSVLLNDTEPTFTGEQTAIASNGSLRGFNIVNDVKAAVESVCAATVSCADLLALLAREAVVAAGGPYWSVELGRRDTTCATGNASFFAANTSLPLSNDVIGDLSKKFAAVGLDDTDLVALTGAHTFGKARCATFNFRLYTFNGTNAPDPTIDSQYLAFLQGQCPNTSDPEKINVIENLDQGTATTFDNSFYRNLLANKGLLSTDQTLQSSGGGTASLVSQFNTNQNQFFYQFACSMIRMGRISPLTGTDGEIRTSSCSFVNSHQHRRLQSVNKEEDICADGSDQDPMAFSTAT